MLLKEDIPFKMLPFLIIILLTRVQDGLMVSKHQYSANYNPNLVLPFEVVAPEHLDALGSRLTVRIRLSPTLQNTTDFSQDELNMDDLYIQLGLYERNGDKVMLTQEKINKAISTNWQEVEFDCGWIVKGGKYFLYVIQYGERSSTTENPSNENVVQHSKISSTLLFPSSFAQNETRSPSQYNVDKSQMNTSEQRNTLNQITPQSSSIKARILVKKVISVTYPAIMFDVPSRLETYTTSAPVTVGLTKTICKPKLKLPSTVLTLTMCSHTRNENSGPSDDDHFLLSSNEDEPRLREGIQDIPFNGNPFNQHRKTNGSSSGSISSHHQHHHASSRNRNHRRKYNTDHYLSQSRPTPSKYFKHNASDFSGKVGKDYENHVVCQRDVSTILQEPLNALQIEGRVTINVDCQLWGRNATYVIQLRETTTRNIIAQSPFINVEWSSKFSLQLSKKSILRCQGFIRGHVSHPQCILPGQDKIRIYGYETLPVPSLLAPSRKNYIEEQQIQNNKALSFRCNIFPARFLRFCFQYVNTAVDGSVAVVLEKCIPTGPANKISDGGWSEWSSWSSCSVTCGIGGKRFRYRFCDSPPPTSGASFCQGKAIQEESCDTGMPCPELPGRKQLLPSGQESGDGKKPSSSTELENTERDGGNRKHSSTSGRPAFMDFSVLNVSTTPGCECGCILYDLVPSKNYSLVILISANQSSCADEDEEDHHNFRWILHARDEKDRIRLDIAGMDVQCVTMTFRDGNTTDSNLMEVITASQPSDPIQFEGLYRQVLGQKAPLYHQQSTYQYDDEDDEEDDSGEDESEEDNDNFYDKNGNEQESNDNMDTKGWNSILRIESTGPSLSIATTSDSSKNCSGQFIYFIAYYSTIRTPVTGIAERKEEVVGYDLWTFLFLKIMVLFFIGVVACTTFGGCVTKVYRKYKYKELKCFDNDEEEGSLTGEGSAGRKSRRDMRDDASRCTSITLMSFDYSYWRRLRLLRLKYFLLRPRPLDPVTTTIKSFPNTPTVSTKRKENVPTSSGRNNTSKSPTSGARRDELVSKMHHKDEHHNPLLFNKPISFSETNLREQSAILAVTKNGYEIRRPWKKKSRATTAENDEGNVHGSTGENPSTNSKQETTLEDQEGVNDMYGGDGTASLTSTSVSISLSQSLNGSETASNNSISTPTPTPTPLFPDGTNKESTRIKKAELRSGGMKHLKEQENLKRRAGEGRVKAVGNEDAQSGGHLLTPRSLSSSDNSSSRGVIKKNVVRTHRDDIRGKGRPKLILQRGDSTASVSTIQSAHLSSTCDDDSSKCASRADLEDTDLDFEMDYYDYDVMNAGNIPGSYLGLEPAFVLWNSEVYSHSDDGAEHENQNENSAVGCVEKLGEDTHGIMEDSAYGIEMTSSGSSIGMLSESGIKETSLDTLKFADDDDDEELETYYDKTDTIPMKNQKKILGSGQQRGNHY